VQGYFGLRYRWLRKLLIKADKRVIFISEADKQAWVGGACGTVVHNFVDLERFNPKVDPAPMLDRLKIRADNTPKVLYLGGFAEIKGIFVLLKALNLLHDRGILIQCLMPGCLGDYLPSGWRGKIRKLANFVGLQNDTHKAKKLIDQLHLKEICKLLPYEQDIPGLLAASDLLVFPSTEPHFARPVVEAGAMGKPVVASDLEGVSELVQEGKTGLLIPANDEMALANAIQKIAFDAEKRTIMGFEARGLANLRFDSRKQIAKIMDIYRHVAPSTDN
jgi:glycosyltransferase involved in cell wall biosynthesis